MFVRWQSRKHTVRCSYLGDENDVHWRADLVESIRVDGKPRQRHIAYLCGFTEQQFKDRRTGKAIKPQQFFVWERALNRLDELCDGFRISAADRDRAEAALAERIGMRKPTRKQIEAFHEENNRLLGLTAARLKDLTA